MDLVCSGTCGERFPAPVRNGLPLISTETLTIIRRTDGSSLAVGVCDTCASALIPPSLAGL